MADETTGVLGAVQNQQEQGITPQVKEYISNGMELIHSPKMQKEVVQLMGKDKGGDAKVLSDVTLKVIKTLDNSMKSNNHQVSDDVRWKGASVFMDQLAEVGKAAGVLNIDNEGLREAAGLAVGQYMQDGVANGTIKEDDLREAYKVIQANNPGRAVAFDPAGTPGVNDSATKIPRTSPGPSILGAE